MDIFSEISKNEGRSSSAGKRSRSDRRWTLIFIGNHGKTITLNRFKGMVVLACVVVAISIAIAGGLLYLSLNVRQDKKLLESEIQDLKAQIQAIRYEKDVLMTKLVLAQSRSKAGPAKAPSKPTEPETPQQNTSEAEKPEQSAQRAKIQESPSPEKNADSPAALNQTEPGLSVALENFKITPRVDENLLRVQFKIKNTTPNAQRVSGHAIVVLKGEQLAPGRWLPIPRVSLSDGKPTGKQRGYTFGINYFKTMRFKANLPKSLSVYQTATVFIFTRKGDLLLEQDFPVNFSTGLPAAASKPSLATPAGATQPSSSPTAVGPPAAVSNPPATPPPTESGPSTPSPDELMDTLKNKTN